MGEIGIDRHTFLYKLRFWEICAIRSGYNHRIRKDYELVRWQTFWLMHNGMTDLGKAGIHAPSDLMSLPWDNDIEDDDMSDEDIEKMRRMIREENDKAKGTA